MESIRLSSKSAESESAFLYLQVIHMQLEKHCYSDLAAGRTELVAGGGRWDIAWT